MAKRTSLKDFQEGLAARLKAAAGDAAPSARLSFEAGGTHWLVRLDGYQTCALIKKSPKFAATPVVMLSSKDGLFDRARGRMVGSNEYLTKPFTKEELLGAIETHIGR